MSVDRFSSRRGSGAALVGFLAAALGSPALGQVSEHGMGLGQACVEPVCVGDNINCTLMATYADSFDDATLITQAFSLVDPFSANERVPAVGDLPIIFVGGNAAATMMDGQPTFPVLIGPPSSMYTDPDTGLTLLGLPDPGQVQVRNDLVTVEATPNPLLILHNVSWIDRCNEEPGGTGCSPGLEQLFTIFSTVNVVPLPEPTAEAMPAQVCLGGTVTLLGGPDGMASYEWRDAMGNIVCLTQDCDVTPTEVGTFEYFLRVVDQNGCDGGGVASTLVTVVDAPQCTITGATMQCPGGENLEYAVVETTGLDPEEFSVEWDLVGDAAFCPDSPTTGPEVTVCADDVSGSFSLSAFVYRNDDPTCFSMCERTVTLDPSCQGDTNCDGVINVNDLNSVILDWGTDGSAHGGDVTGPSPDSPPDGVVNVNDLNAVIVNWGTCP